MHASVRSEVEPEVAAWLGRAGRRLTITAVKSAVAVVVLWAVGRHVYRTWNDLRDQSRSAAFRAGLAGRVRASLPGGSLGLRPVLRADTASQSDAGPARARRCGPTWSATWASTFRARRWWWSMRAGMVVPFGARASTAAIATFYETLVMMAAGGLIAAAGFAPAAGSHPVEIALPGWGRSSFPLYRLAALAGWGWVWRSSVLVVPPVFGRLAGLVSLPIPGVGPEALPRITWRLLAQGLLWSSAAGSCWA